MKKFIAVLCVILLSMCLFVGCADDSQNTIDLEKCEIGDELPIYPNCEFDYKVDENYTVHISSIKLTLVEKKYIIKDSCIDDSFYKYTIKFAANGSTHKTLSGKTVDIRLADIGLQYSLRLEINEDGSFGGDTEIYTNSYIIPLTFFKIVIS